jgi:hypothetical protein
MVAWCEMAGGRWAAQATGACLCVAMVNLGGRCSDCSIFFATEHQKMSYFAGLNLSACHFEGAAVRLVLARHCLIMI